MNDLDELAGRLRYTVAAEHTHGHGALMEEAADAIEAAARERDAMREELEEARTLDRGFYEWMIERNLLQRGEEVEWPDIVTALTEHEIELIDAGDRAAKAGSARQALNTGEQP